MPIPSSQRSGNVSPETVPRIPGNAAPDARGAGHKLRLLNAPDALSFLPVASIMGVLMGTLLAVSLVPYKVSTPGALRSSAIALMAGLAAGPILSSFFNVRNIMRTENLIGLAPIYWLLLDLVTGAYEMERTSREAVMQTFWVMGFGTIAYWFGTMARPWSLPAGFMRSCAMRFSTKALLPIVLFCFFLAMLRFAIPCNFDMVLMFKSVINDRFSAPWSRGSMGGWDSFADHLSYFGYLLPTLAIIMARRTSWYNFTTLISLICASIFLLFLAQSGSRRIIGVCLGAALLYWILDRKKIKLYQLVISGAAIVGILFIMQMMIVSRMIGIGEAGLGNTSSVAYYSLKGEDLAAGAIPKGLHIDDNFLRLSQTILLVPTKFDYVYHKQIMYLLLRPIPRVFWPEKPTNAGFELYKILDSGASLTTTILGEFWISWGWIAVALGGWFFGRLACLSSPLFNSTSGSLAPMFYGYMTMTLFVGYRSLVEVILFSYAMLGWWFAAWVMGKFR